MSDANVVVPADSEKLLSAGVPADSTAIQLLDTVGVAGATAAIGLIPTGLTPVLIAVAIAVLAFIATHYLRVELVLNNERVARDARVTRYRFPRERHETIAHMHAPADVREAALTLVGDQPLLRIEIQKKLNERLGEARTAEYLPAILHQADSEIVAGVQ